MTSRINFRQPEALWDRIALKLGDRPRQKFIALTLVAALLAFEAFNFDTTKIRLRGSARWGQFLWGSHGLLFWRSPFVRSTLPV